MQNRITTSSRNNDGLPRCATCPFWKTGERECHGICGRGGQRESWKTEAGFVCRGHPQWDQHPDSRPAAEILINRAVSLAGVISLLAVMVVW